MRGRGAAARPAGVAVLAALATAGGGCSVGLVDQTSRASGFAGATYVSRAHAVSRDEVPVHGHRVRVIQVGGGEISGELIAASEDEMVVAPPQGSLSRIPISRVRLISIELAPPQAGTTMLITLGAMIAGVAGLASDPSRSSVGAFFGGWGVAWLPLGLFVALPTALVLLATGDGSLNSISAGMDPLVRNLYQFARFPQGEPGRVPKPPPTATTTHASPRAPGVTPPLPTTPPPALTAPAATPPRPSIEAVPSVAPPPAAPPPAARSKPAPAPAPPAKPEDESEPAVVPYSPDRTPPSPKR